MIRSNPQAYEVWIEGGIARLTSTSRRLSAGCAHLGYFARIAQARSCVRAYNRKARAAEADVEDSYFSGCQTMTFEPR